MIDLKTVKNITISEGSVTKITDSSGVVLWQKATGSSASLDVDLNNQWIASTKTLDGYKVYMSNSNHNVNNGYASMKFKFKGMPNFKLWINSYAESSYDYTVAWNLDVNYPTSNPSSSSSGVKAHTSGNQKDPTTIDNFTEVDYTNDGGEHFVVVTYRKDSSVNNNDDRGYVAVRLTLLSTTWVVSSTEFIKKDGKYYQRINEVGTYEGGITSNTGNYKEGDELTVTYKQGSADDYMIVGSGKYYKKYAYVMPKDQEINTGDYIQGDYIGEAIPAMKVTYTDNSEKTFYNLTTIDSNTDPNNSNAKNVEIYDSVTSIGSLAFASCWSLTSITIPNSVTSINNNAFSNCSSLTGITIPNSVTSINNNAFDGCSSLATVTIQNSSNKLEYSNNAFANISSTAKLYVPSNLLADYQADSKWTGAFGGGIYEIQIPAMKVIYTDNTEKTFYNLTSINSDTDSNKKNAKEVIIYDGVTAIGYQAFKDCSDLTSVTLPNSLTSIGNYAFWYCSSLTDITIPDSVTSIGEGVFSNCSGLTSVTLPNSVTSIGQSAFIHCSSLTGITIPDSVTIIGDSAFRECSAITGITIPNGVMVIDTQLFQSCTNLASLTIPSSVDTIKKYAFNGCSNLTSATYQGTIAQWNAIRKERYWDKGSSLKTVHCTDGDRVV